MKSLLTFFLWFCLVGVLIAEEPAPADKPNEGAQKEAYERQAKGREEFGQFRKEVRESAQKEFEARQAQYKDQPEMLVLPGILANKKERWVKMDAVFSAVIPGEPIEVFICLDGGNEHETVLITSAKAADLRQAIEFIGMKPGSNICYEKNRYRPLGERLMLDVAFRSKDDKEITVPLEELILSSQTGKPMERKGFVFAGSSWSETEQDGKKEKVLLADVSRFLVGAFHTNTTLLENPEPVGILDMSNEVLYQLNPQYLPLRGKRAEVILKPELPEGEFRTAIFETQTTLDDKGTIHLATEAPALNIHWKDQTPEAFVEAVQKLDLKNKDAHLQLSVETKMPLMQMVPLSKTLLAMDWVNILCDENTPHPLCFAKSKKEWWANVGEVGNVPKRVRLYRKNNRLVADAFNEVGYQAKDLEALLAHPDYRLQGLPVVFCGIHEELTCGEFLPFYRAIAKTQRYIHIMPLVPWIELGDNRPCSAKEGPLKIPFEAQSPEGLKQYKVTVVEPDAEQEKELIPWTTLPEKNPKTSKEESLEVKIQLQIKGKNNVIIYIEDNAGNVEKRALPIIQE